MTKLEDTVLRTDSIRNLDAARDHTDIAKIITGIRRCGKSTLMMQYIQHLKDNGISDDRIFYINLESEENMDVDDHLQLRDIIKANLRKDIRTYVFFDEIQRVRGWEKNINSLMTDYDADIYITGSNAYLLSSELATYISGRYVEIKMLPLSFSEYMELHPLSERENTESRFNDFLRYGALPSVDPKSDRTFIMDHLQGIYNTILMKDVVSRLGVRNTGVLGNIARYLFSNIGNLTNVLTISKHAGISPTTVRNYLTALEEAYIVYKAERYDVRGKKILSSNEKYYAADTGIRNSMLGWQEGPDIGRQIENIVYLELCRRGYKVMIGRFRDSEVDFAAFNGNEIEYFQVTQTMLSDETSKREINSLTLIDDNHPKTILSLDRIMTEPGNGIKHVNLIDWLLGM